MVMVVFMLVIVLMLVFMLMVCCNGSKVLEGLVFLN